MRLAKAVLAAGLLFGGAAFALSASTAHALDNGVGRTPPMGWNSWNTFGRFAAICERSHLPLSSH